MALTLQIVVFERQIYSSSVPWRASITVHQAMETAYNAADPKDPRLRNILRFDARYYGMSPSSLGYFLAQLDSITQQAGADGMAETFLFWELLVNNKQAPAGMDETILDDDDVITWHYGPYIAEKHDGTRYELLRKAAMAEVATEEASSTA